MNRYADWSQVLTSVGTRPEAAALPYRAGCPVCGTAHQFTVYADPVYSGQWFRCAGCGAAGDMIELAAAVWKVGVKLAARRLLAEGRLAVDATRLENYLPAYADRMVGYRRRIAAFWEACRLSTRPVDCGAVRVLISKIGLTPEIDVDVWRRRTGRLVGACTRKEAEAALRLYPEEASDQPNEGRNRPFVGDGWAEVLVIPAWDLPGRIRSFTFVGRQGGQNDVMVRQVNGTGATLTELGLVGLPECLGADRAVVVDDPLDCLRMHDRYYRMHDDPFPVLARHAGHHARTTKCWSTLHGKRVVFWGMRTTHELVRLARETGGAVCGEDQCRDPATKYLSRLDPRVWLDGVTARAAGWLETLEGRLAGQPAAPGETELAALALTAAERSEVAGRADLPVVAARLRSLAAATGRTASVDGKVYTETRDGWRRGGENVCSARLQINRIVATSRGPLYEGVIRAGDREIPFRDRVDAIEDAPRQWLRRTAAAAGVLVTVARNINPVLVAQAFHPPVGAKGRERCGWDGDAAGFVFADFTVTRRGVEPEGVAMKLAGTPTTGCRPEPPTPTDWLALTAATPAAALLWAVAGGVAAQVLAPAFRLPTTGVAVEGPGAVLACRMAGWLGCGEYAPARPKRTGMALLMAGWEKAETAHGWPILLGSRGSGTGAGAWFRAAVGADGDRNCVTPCGWDEARVLALTGRWTVVTADAGDAGDLRQPAAGLMAAFLGWLLKRGLALPGDGGLTARTLDGMAEWVRDQGYDPAVVRAARALTDPAPVTTDRPAAVAAAFGDLAGRLAAQGEIRDRQWYGGADGDAPRPGTVLENGTIWVPKADIYGPLSYRGLPPIDDTALTANLARAGIAQAEARYDPPVDGWAINYSWWRDQLDRYKTRNHQTRAAG